jgi:hypothetical protein
LRWFPLGAGIGFQTCLRRVCAKYQVAPSSGSFSILKLKIKSESEVIRLKWLFLGWFPLGVGIVSQACLGRACAKYQVGPPSGFFSILKSKIKSE